MFDEANYYNKKAKYNSNSDRQTLIRIQYDWHFLTLGFKLLILLILPLYFNTVFSQNTNYQQSSWYINQDFGTKAILDIAHMPDGRLLLATYNGLMTFNGTGFSPLLSVNSSIKTRQLIYNIAIDKKGVIWALNKDNLIKIDSEKIFYFHLTIKDMKYNLLTLDNLGNPWVIVDNNLYTLKNNSLKKINTSLKVYSLTKSNGNFIFVNSDKGIQKIDYNGVQTNFYTFDRGENLVSNTMYHSKDGSLWLGSKKGLYRLKDNHLTRTPISDQNLIINKIYEDSKGSIWLGTDKNIYNLTGDYFEPFKLSLPSEIRIRGITEDSFGNIWFGSWSKGLNRLRVTDLDYYEANIKSLWAYFVSSNGNKWFYTYNDSLFLKTNKATIKLTNPLINNSNKFISIIEGLNNEIWISFDTGILHYNNSGVLINQYLSPNGSTKQTLMINDHYLWSLFGTKVYSKNLTNSDSFKIVPEFKNLDIYNIKKMDDKILIQTKVKSYIYHNNILQEFLLVDNFQEGFIYQMIYSNKHKTLWYYLYDSNSLVKIKANTKTSYMLDNRLKNLPIYNITLDDSGNLFMLGESGLIKIEKKWFDQYDKNKISTLLFNLLITPMGNKQECTGSQNAISKDSKGNILFNCTGGILKYSINKKVKSNNERPKLNINEIIINDQAILRTTYQFPPETLSYQFTFNSHYLNIDYPLEYRYKLIGIDENWHYTSKPYSSSYIALPSGKYQFEVQVKESASQWITSQDAVYSFRVTTNWYQTNWFKVLAVILMLLLLVLIVNLIIRRLKKTQIKLASLVKEKTKSLREIQEKELKKEDFLNQELSHQVQIRTEELKNQLERTLEIERQLKQSQKMELIGHLTSGIAHDFNNLLAIIFLKTDILKYNFKSGNYDSSDNNKSLNQIILASERCREIITQLLYFAKTKEAQMKKVDIGEVLDESISLFKVALPKSIKLDIYYDNLNNIIKLDVAKFNQIVLNLLVNARDACLNSGLIEIKTSQVNLSQTKCTSCQEIFTGQYIQMSVKDNGKGITDELLENIFTPFYSTKGNDKGSGIGLQIVHKNIHEMGGHILIDNKIKPGVNFHSLFPLYFEEEKESADNDKILQNNVTFNENYNKNVLLVEDSLSLANSLKQVLNLHNISVDIAKDGKEGFLIYEENHGKYDLIITDNIMPVMEGTELIKTIRIIDASIPIFLFTGYQDQNLLNEIKDLDVNEIIQKPFNSSKLLEKIKQHTS